MKNSIANQNILDLLHLSDACFSIQYNEYNEAFIIRHSRTTSVPNDDLYTDEIMDLLDSKKITKLIILSVNPRSGSSYISEILSSPPLSALWAEPLRFLYEKPPMNVKKISLSDKEKHKKSPGCET